MLYSALSPLDFSIADTRLIFSAGEGPQTNCTDVIITSDDGLESEESFTLLLESSDPAVNSGPMAVTRIIITDADGNVEWCSIKHACNPFFNFLSSNICQLTAVKLCCH